MKSNPLIVVGLDGATFDLLQPLIEQGLMPNLKKIMAQAAWGNLQCPLPPVSTTSWCTFFTGVNPGKHGVFGFFQHKYDPKRRTFANSTSVKAPTLWDMVSSQGKTAGVINVPITYPPQPLNGYMISGFPTPENPAEFTYPAHLKHEISEHAPKYIIDIPVKDLPSTLHKSLSLIDQWALSLEQRHLAVKHLLERYPTDLTVIVYETMDRLQHLFWELLYDFDEGKNNEMKMIREAALNCYAKIDQCLGDILSILPEDGTLILMSDHGFGPIEKSVFMNNWLAQHGFLRLKRLGLTKKSLRLIASRLSRGLLPLRLEDEAKDIIDWRKTSAYAGDVSEQGIFINLAGRERFGIVPERDYDRICAEIKERLLNALHPSTGKRFVDNVFLREELYHGQHLEHAPDILVIMKEFAYLMGSGVSISAHLKKDFFKTDNTLTGFHRRNGIFACYSKHLPAKPGIGPLAMEDMAPLILYLLGLEIPRHLDGQIPNYLFTDDYFAQNPPRYTDRCEHSHAHVDVTYDDAEKEDIKKQLTGLGYL